jgi:hypothetical protein
MLNYIVTKFDALMMRNFSYKGWRNRRIKVRVEREIAAHNELARIEKQYADKVAVLMKELRERYADGVSRCKLQEALQKKNVWEIYEGYAREYDAAMRCHFSAKAAAEKARFKAKARYPDVNIR